MGFAQILGSAAGGSTAGSFLSSVGGLGGIGSLLSGVSGLLGSSGDGVSGKALGAQRAQWGWQRKQEQDYTKHALMNFQPMSLQNEYDAWIKNMYPIQQRQIQDRVTDAKAAGLHPLFALGQPSANLPSFSAGGVPQGGGSSMPNIPGQSVTGSHKGDKLLAMGNALMAYEQNKANAELTNVQADYYRSLIKKTESDMAATGTSVPPGSVNVVPREQVAHKPTRPDIAAGSPAFFSDYVIGHDKFGNPITAQLPHADNPAEATENMGGLLMSALKKWGFLDEPLRSSIKNNSIWQWKDKHGRIHRKPNPFKYPRR